MIHDYCPDRTPVGYESHLWIRDQDRVVCTYCQKPLRVPRNAEQIPDVSGFGRGPEDA